MKTKGFTLIELLAVIVILAIIAIIATPIVLNIIKDASESAAKESATAYIKAVEQGYVSKLTKNEKIENGEYNISTLDELGIKVKGDKPSGDDDYVTLQNGKAIEYQLTIKEYIITYKDENLIVDSGKDNDSKDKITPLDYTVTFMVDGEPYEIVTVKDGNYVNAPKEPTKEQYLFQGWKNGSEVFTFPITPTADIIVSAEFSSTLKTIYNHFNVDNKEYPYVIFYCQENSSYFSVYFIKSYSISGSEFHYNGLRGEYPNGTYNGELSNFSSLMSAVLSTNITLQEKNDWFLMKSTAYFHSNLQMNHAHYFPI